MRFLFGALLLLFLAASTTLIAMRDPGYVLISREPYSLETSLAIFLVLLTAVFVAFYYLLRLAFRLWNSPGDLTRWRQTRRTRRARESFLEGLRNLALGDWYKAEKSLLACMHAVDSPQLASLGAAIAAHGQGDVKKRDQYLSQAGEIPGTGGSAVLILKTKMLLADGNLPAARSVLMDLQAERMDHSESARLLVSLLRQENDWTNVVRLLPAVRRHSWIPEQELYQIEIEAHASLLRLPLPANAGSALDLAWESVPKQIRSRPRVVAAYVRQLINQNRALEGREIIETILENSWEPELVNLYGQVTDASDAASRLEVAEEWLARHGEEQEIFLALGRLTRRAGQAGRARQFLEKSLRIRPSADAHEELATLSADEGDLDGALDHCRQAIRLC